MPKPKTCIDIVGTRTNRLRARVEIEGERRFEVTLGGNEWTKLDPHLCEKILERAEKYIKRLTESLNISRSNVGCDPFEAGDDEEEDLFTAMLRLNIKMRTPSDFGDRMTLEEFQSMLHAGAIVDYDGHGYYATDRMESDRTVSFDSNQTPPHTLLTHVMWYNK